MSGTQKKISGYDYVTTIHREISVDTSGRLITVGDATGIAQATGRFVDLKPTVTVTAALYTIGDSIGGKLVLTNAVVASGGVSELVNMTLVDLSNQKPVMELLFFNADPTASTITDKTGFVLNTADRAKVIARVPVAAADWVSVNAQGVGSVVATRGLKAASGTSLWVAMIAVGAPTFTATTNLDVRFIVDQH